MDTCEVRWLEEVPLKWPFPIVLVRPLGPGKAPNKFLRFQHERRQYLRLLRIYSCYYSIKLGPSTGWIAIRLNKPQNSLHSRVKALDP
jgi:hypothetical protein